MARGRGGGDAEAIATFHLLLRGVDKMVLALIEKLLCHKKCKAHKKYVCCRQAETETAKTAAEREIERERRERRRVLCELNASLINCRTVLSTFSGI